VETKETVMGMTRVAAAMAAAALVLGGCAAPGMGSRDYTPYNVQNEQSVRFGVVESVREVRIDLGQSGVGTAAGAALGSIAGAQMGKGSGSAAGAIAGAVAGGLLGQAIEGETNKRLGVEITVLLDGGRYIAVTQEADESFRPGDRVRILTGNGITRVSH